MIYILMLRDWSLEKPLYGAGYIGFFTFRHVSGFYRTCEWFLQKQLATDLIQCDLVSICFLGLAVEFHLNNLQASGPDGKKEDSFSR